MKGRPPNKDEKEFMDRMCQLGCIVCRNMGYMDSPASPHHIQGRTRPGAHYHIIPLCGKHHQVPDPEGRWVSRHGDGKAEFEREHGTEEELYFQCLELLNELND